MCSLAVVCCVITDIELIGIVFMAFLININPTPHKYAFVVHCCWVCFTVWFKLFKHTIDWCGFLLIGCLSIEWQVFFTFYNVISYLTFYTVIKNRSPNNHISALNKLIWSVLSCPLLEVCNVFFLLYFLITWISLTASKIFISI